VARTTTSAETVPRAVDADPGAMAVTRVPSSTCTPRRSTPLRGVAREDDRAALRVVGVDALESRHPAELVDRLAHRPVLGERSGATSRHPGQSIGRDREQRGAPAAVAAGRAEAHHLGLEDGDAQARVGLSEVVGRPQAGEAATDDRDVDIDVAVETRPRGQTFGGRGVPQRRSVVRAQRTPQA
jgi:hypothetical protein